MSFVVTSGQSSILTDEVTRLCNPPAFRPARSAIPFHPSRSTFRAALLALSCFFPLVAHAGGSGLNTVIIVNQSSTNSLALANYYAEERQIAPDNILRIA